MEKFITPMLLISMLASLTYCGNTDLVSDSTSSDTGMPVEIVDDNLVHDDLGDIKFDGETFTIWLYHTTQLGYRMEEETGDVFDDAVFARNRAVEERLGITLEFNDSGIGKSGNELPQSCKMIESFILAGDTANDVYLHCQFSSMPQLINNRYFVDWNTMPNINLEKPYWAQKAINDINYGSKIYMMTGLYEYEVMANANCLIFNKRIFDEMQIEYPYQSVEDGTWTYDKWMQIVTDTSHDLNGDAKYDLTADRYGYAGGLWQMPYTFFVGMAGDLLTKDKDNMPINVVTSEHNIDIIDRLMVLANDTSGAVITATTADVTNAFVSGRVATTHNTLSYLPSSLRDMKDDFGFVPSPKYDEAQKEYNVWISNSTSMTYIPITNERLELTGAVLEVMAMESYNHVIPTYVDTVLTIKSTRDTESESMVPYILKRASFFDHSLNMLQLPYTVRDNISLVTFYAQKQSQIEEFLKNLTETYK